MLAALGPRLAEAGVPAVLAMQGNISVATISRFMPVFFRELQRDGQIDRAMAAARAAVRDRHDWWAPALFMRLRSGRHLVRPRLRQPSETFEKFPALVNEIRKRTVHADARSWPQRPAARLSSGDRPALGEELPLSRWRRTPATTCRRSPSTCR